MKTIISNSESDTIKAAKDLAAEIKPNEIIFLNGTLGMGKTVFARALIRALYKDDTLEVISPTFTLVQTYDTDIAPIAHYDLYRIEDPDEIFELGWEDSLTDGITIVEWPRRLGPYAPTSYLDISITNTDNDARKISISRFPHKSGDLNN